MDCYSDPLPDGSTNADGEMPSAETLKSAVTNFFRIPSELWPEGLHVAFKGLETKALLRDTARSLLSNCALVSIFLPLACMYVQHCVEITTEFEMPAMLLAISCCWNCDHVVCLLNFIHVLTCKPSAGSRH